MSLKMSSECHECGLGVAAGSVFCDERCTSDYAYRQENGVDRACANADCSRSFRSLTGLVRFCGQCDPRKSRSAVYLAEVEHECAGCDWVISRSNEFCSYACFQRHTGEVLEHSRVAVMVYG